MLRVASNSSNPSNPSNGYTPISTAASVSVASATSVTTAVSADSPTLAANERNGITGQLRGLQPDAALRFRHKNGETYLDTSSDVQNLLGLKSPHVALGLPRTRRDFSSMAEIDPRNDADTNTDTNTHTKTKNREKTAARAASAVPHHHPDIPVEHRAYLHESNDQLMQRYLDAHTGVRTQDHVGRPLPHDIIRANILAALDLDPGRRLDAEILRVAFKRIDGFMPIYRDMLATAGRERPDLRAHIQHVAQEILLTAVHGALADENIHHHLVPANQLVAAAARHRSTVQRQDSRSYYTKSGRIPGSGEHATQDDIGRLASGRIEYPSATELLRYGPIGTVFHQWSHHRHHDRMSTLQPPTEWHEPQVSYPGGQVVELFYREHHGAHGTRPRSIMLAQDGYIVQYENIQHYPEVISDEARQENLERLNMLVGNARERLGLPRLAHVAVVPPEPAQRGWPPR